MIKHQPLKFVGETLPIAFPGQPYSQNIASRASGGKPPYRFSLISASSGSWSASSGVISGTA